MNKVKLGYYTLEEAAQRWGCTVYEIINWAANNLLKICEAKAIRRSYTSKSLPAQHFEYILKNISPDGSQYSIARSLIITEKELLRFEKEQEFRVTSEEKRQGKLLEMPKNHPYFSSELEIATQCWRELYAQGEKLQPKRGHKQMILEWLNKNYPDKKSPTNAARERIATVVNPNIKGGAPTQE